MLTRIRKTNGVYDGTAAPWEGKDLDGSIGRILNKAAQGIPLEREEVITLLSVDAAGDAAAMLHQAGRAAARRFGDDRGRVWAAIGVDYQPCPMNCRFCAFGESWGIVRSAMEWPVERIEAQAVDFAEQGAHWITLRTTEHYSIDRLCSLCRRIIRATRGKVKLVANTGELTRASADRLREAGFTTVYHSCRLREGTDTTLSADIRLSTIKAVREAGIDLAHLVEPVGVEHSPREIADCLLQALAHGASLTGAMARVPVPGTPLAVHGPLPKPELARIVAVTRIVAGPRATDICVHPPCREGLQAGANTVVVETGAVPREMEATRSEWQAFTISEARALLASAGYNVSNA